MQKLSLSRVGLLATAAVAMGLLGSRGISAQEPRQVQGNIYTYVDDDGVRHYTVRRPETGQELRAIPYSFSESGQSSTTRFARVLNPSEIFERAAPSIVVVWGSDEEGNHVTSGSGVVIGKNRIVTNCHVFKTAHSAEVEYFGHRMSANLEYVDLDRDLCSFTANGLGAPPVEVGSSTLMRVGARVYAIGAPRGLSLTLSDGLLSGLRPLDDGFLLQTTAPISPGSSGGGLFNESGQLVGITTLYLEDSQQLNFAVPVEWVFELQRRNAKRAQHRDSESSANLGVRDASLGTGPAMTGPLVTRIEIGRAIDAYNKVSAPTRTFRPHDTLYASVETLAPVVGYQEVTISARWIYGAEQLIRDDARRYSLSGGAATAFELTKPDGWPPGRYRVEIRLNGVLEGTAHFLVQ